MLERLNHTPFVSVEVEIYCFTDETSKDLKLARIELIESWM